MSQGIQFINERCTKIIKNEVKEQNRGFLGILLGTLGASLLEHLFTGKGVKAKIPGQGVIRADEEAIATSQGQGTIRAGHNF